MKKTFTIVICSLLLASSSKAAFRDFIVEAEEEPNRLLGEPSNDLALGCPASDEEKSQISLHDVELDGIVDPQLLLNALLQHAQDLGMSLEQFAHIHAVDEDDIFGVSDIGCSAAEPLSYREQHSWYDVFFN